MSNGDYDDYQRCSLLCLKPCKRDFGYTQHHNPARIWEVDDRVDEQNDHVFDNEEDDQDEDNDDDDDDVSVKEKSPDPLSLQLHALTAKCEITRKNLT